MTFQSEAAFEEALIAALLKRGWEGGVLHRPSEQDLLHNWANILFKNNNTIDRLNDQPLTEGEMQQIIEQINALRTPLKLNGFVNGKTVSIVRDNALDTLHFGKEISLKIYDRYEIAAGQTFYQIAQQPIFKKKSKLLHDRRGDLMLLINGMPLFHIELKKSGVPLSQACHQIEKYAKEGIFTGLFALVQLFVAMTPEETVYFANPGPEGIFNPSFYFHWADVNNEPKNHWRDISTLLLSIPMAHQLIGFYTIADDTDGVLKVLRSYQYYAVNAISDTVAKTDWESKHALGGYIWHTTGSGKTMTSFKSAQLIANSQDADKVIFLMDRIELGDQSVIEYRGFAEESEQIQDTKSTDILVSKLKSTDPAHTLIVSSIQKMSNIHEEGEKLNGYDIEQINEKRIVFIVDEAHRSTFGDMLSIIKDTFSSAIFFGFTGTPIQKENQKKLSTTAMVFGNELHRYSIADGIRDENVLGFDPYKVLTYNNSELRKEVALAKAKAKDEAEAMAEEKKKKIYLKYMNEVKMAGYLDKAGGYVSGIEDMLPKSQYNIPEHQQKVISDIQSKWFSLSQGGKFHAIFATNSIGNAITYYRMLKAQMPTLKTTALFDPNIDNNEGFEYKEEGLEEVISDYNERYRQNFDLASHGKFKKDIAARLAHKKPYQRITTEPAQQLDLLIVVDQMLTGFDSKWINTLYMDKVLRYENIIQAFSRTNRVFGYDKPFGTIRYYRYPNSMERNINDAIKLYSGDKPIGLFVSRLLKNLKEMNQIFEKISDVFHTAGVSHFEKLPDDRPDRAKFAKLYNELNVHLEAAKVQAFVWKELTYGPEEGEEGEEVTLVFDETVYLTLAERYKELSSGEGGTIGEDIPFDIEGHLTEIDTGRIDADYMNARFEKFIKAIKQDDLDPAVRQSLLDELHKSFATLSQEEQKYANIFLHEVQSGDKKLEEGKSIRDYITDYQYFAKNEQVVNICHYLGLDEQKLRALMNSPINEQNLNEYGRFDELKDSVNKPLAKKYFEEKQGESLSMFKVNIAIRKLLQKFVLEGGCEV